MIFKTFQSELDGISNKIGFSKRSFAEWGKQVSTSFKESEGVVNRFKNALKTAFIIPVEKDNGWIKNNIGEIVTKKNIDTFIPELDTDSARAELETLQNIQNKINETKGSWDDYNKQFQNGRKYLLDYAKQNNVLESSVDNVKEANQQARASALAHNEAIKAQTFSAKAGKVALQALAMAGNMLIGWAISKAISFATEKLDEFAHAAENAKEKAKTSKQELDSLTSEINDLNKELETTKDRIIELLEKANSGTISLLEEEELDNLREQNDELQREIALKEKLAEIDAKEAADNAAYSLTYRTDDNKWDDEYNATDRIDKLQKYVDSANFYQDKLSEINQQILDIEKSTTDNSYKDDSVYKDLIKHQEEYQNGLKKVEEQMSSIYKELSVEDDGLYYNGKVIEGYEDLAERLDTVYMTVELYLDEDNVKDTTRDYIETIKSKLIDSGLSDEISSAVSEGFSEEELNSIMNSDSIDWSQCLGLEDATDVIENIKEQLASITANENPISSLSISQTIDQLNTQLKPAFDSLQSAYQDIFTDDGKFALNSIDILSTCDTIKSKLDEMSDLEGVNLDVDYSAFEDFVRVLNNTESTEQDVEKAFDSLATSIIQTALSGAEDFETMKAALEDLGVVNETIIAFQALAQNTNALKESGLDLASATYAQLEAFAREKLGAENAAQGVAILVYQQMLIANNPLDTMASIQALANLGGKAAETAGILAELAQIMAQISNLQTWIANNPGADSSLVEATLGGLERKAEKLKSQIYTGVDFENVGGGKSSASKAGKEAADAYLEAFQKEYDQLKDLLDRGEISEAQYLNRLRSLYTRYFKDRKEYLDEYKKYESEYLSGMFDLHNKALSGISTLLNQKINAANDAKDSAISALEEEKEAAAEAYQTQIDALEEEKNAIDDLIKEKDKKIDALNEEADAIQKAAETRKKNIDLQKEEYNLERMLNQRTTSVYKEGKGFVFEADTSGIRDAREKVKEAKEELEIDRLQREADLIQKEIDLLEEKKDALTEEQEAIQKMLDESNKYYDNLIKQQEKMWDSMIKGMEQQKSKWEELANIQEIAEAYSAVQQVFGELGYSVEDVLNGSGSAFEDFKSRYIAIMSDLNQNTSFQEGLEYASGVAKEKFGSIVSDAQNTVQQLSQTFSDGTFSDAISKGVSDGIVAAQQELDNMNQLGNDAGDGFIEGWKEKETEISDATKQTAENAVDAFAEGQDSNSPSEKYKGLAGDAIDGLLLGVEENKQAFIDTVRTLAEEGVLAFEEGFNFEDSTLNTSFDALKLLIESVTEALGFGTDETIGGLLGALTQLSDFSFSEEGILTQFNNLKAAIDSVTSAISGGGGSSDGEGASGGESISGTFKGGKQAKKGFEGGNGNSLTGAIESIGDTASKVIGEPDAEGDGTVIGEFGSLETAVNDVTTAIGSGDSESGGSQSKGESDSGNLIDSIVNLGETTEETLGEPDGDGVTGRFGQFRDVVGEANEQVHCIADGLAAIDGQTVECTIKINIDSDGFPAYASGTTLGAMNLESAEYNAKYEGNAHVSGTANVTGNWGVRKPGKSLVGEVGQEIWVHSADGTFETVGDNGPEWIKTEKGDLIFNHLQTKELLDKGNIVKTGKAYANGNIQYSDGTVIQPDGSVLSPLQPGDKMYDLYHAFDAYLKSIDGNLEKLVPNSFYEQNREWNKLADQISYANSVVNNRNVQQPVTIQIGDINLTGVQDVNGLAHAIKTRLPNAMLQERHRR